MGFVKGGSAIPSGPAGGDLGGTYPDPIVENVSILTTTGDLLYESATAIASRLAIGTTGQVLTVAAGVPSWATPASSAGGEIGYDQITSPVSIASTTEATGTSIIAGSSHTFDGSPVIVTFFSPGIYTGTATSAQVTPCLFESTTQICRLGYVFDAPIGGMEVGVCFVYRFTPSAGAHTYKVTAFASSLTGTPRIDSGTGAGTSALSPTFLRFTKV